MEKKKQTRPPASSERRTQADRDADVTPQERADLARSTRNPPDSDDRSIHAASLDEMDAEGEPLEEFGLDEDVTGGDLDVPGAELDDEEEAIGEEDEENNEYSLGGDNHDD